MKITGYTDEQRRKSSRLALLLTGVAVALFSWGVYLAASGQYANQSERAAETEQAQ